MAIPLTGHFLHKSLTAFQQMRLSPAGGHSGSQGKTGGVFLWGDASGKYHPLDLRCWDEPFFGSMYKLLIQEHRLCRLGKSFYCFIAA